jgi:hypothetical protein
MPEEVQGNLPRLYPEYDCTGPHVAIHFCSCHTPASQEVEVKGPRVQGQPGLHSKICLKTIPKAVSLSTLKIKCSESTWLMKEF